MKAVLVTGAAGGLGQSICKLLIQQGCTVYGLDLAAHALPPEVHFIPCDLRSADSVDAAAEALRDCPLDAIVHAAGLYALDSLLEISEAELLRVFEVNLFGVYRVNRCFVPQLRPGGRIVIVSSELAPLYPLPFTGLYAITKAALEKYAASLRMEVQLLGLSVSILRPGAIRTPLLDASTRALDAFVAHTQTYHCNAIRFRSIVDRVEARSVSPERVARRILRILRARRPRFVSHINRNPLLLLLNLLPARLQVFLIGRILREK